MKNIPDCINCGFKHSFSVYMNGDSDICCTNKNRKQRCIYKNRNGETTFEGECPLEEQ